MTKLRLALSAGVAIAAFVGSTPDASGSVSCAHSEAPANVLEVVGYEDPSIDLDFADGVVKRAGDSIQVSSLSETNTCSGPAATLQNTEQVSFLQQDLNFATFSLAGGPLAPGGSVEPDGTNETEVRFVAERGSLAYGEIRGTSRADRWLLGRQSGITGASLTPDGPPEIDVSYVGPGKRIVVASGGAGDDSIRASGVGSLTPLKSWLILDGGKGADRLFGGQSFNAIDAGAGPDRVFGSGGLDILDGGRGRDRLDGGAGKDRLDARDNARDIVICGPGRDRASVDAVDVVRGCERLVPASR